MSCNRPNNIWANLFQRINNNPNTNSICPTEYFYKEDEQYLDYFNKNNKNPNHEIKLGFIPEPRVGNIDADIFILSANPRADLFYFCDIIDESSTGTNIINSQEKIKNLNNQNCDNFLIKLGQEWWDRKFVLIQGGFGEKMLKSQNIKNITSNQLVQIRNILSKKVCTLEYFPYYSNQFNHENLCLPSSKYMRDLILYIICNNKHIIFNKKLSSNVLKERWFNLVPELYDYYVNSNKVFTLSNTYNNQKVSISNNKLIDNKGNNGTHIDYICKQLGIYGIIP